MNTKNNSETLIITCPNYECKQKLRIPKSEKNKRFICPKCKKEFVCPAETSIRRITSRFLKMIKVHPMFFGLILTFWTLIELNMYRWKTLSLKNSFYLTFFCLILWLIGTWVIESFKEKGTKWYYRKWFVFLMLIFIPPLGITLLWAGSIFKKATKIVLTFIFGLLFISSVLTQTTRRFHFSPEKEIAGLIRAPKENIFIKSASDLVKKSFQYVILTNQIPITDVDLTITQIVQNCGDSVVLVKSIDKEGQEIGLGSGFLVTKDGGIITNYHLIESALNVSIEFSNGKTYTTVSFIVGDPSLDIAVLNIDSKGDQFSPLILGDSDCLQVGEKVAAIGNPFGWRNSISDGLISGIREIDGLSLLQITTPISPGSSGGALLNMRGEVIGITTLASLWGAQNLNFAIPINSLKSLVKNWTLK